MEKFFGYLNKSGAAFVTTKAHIYLRRQDDKGPKTFFCLHEEIEEHKSIGFTETDKDLFFVELTEVNQDYIHAMSEMVRSQNLIHLSKNLTRRVEFEEDHGVLWVRLNLNFKPRSGKFLVAGLTEENWNTYEIPLLLRAQLHLISSTEDKFYVRELEI